MFIHLHKYALRGCLLIALLLGACAAPAAEQRQPVTLKVVVLPFLSYAPFFIAQEEGYFTEQGLEIEFVKMDRTAGAIPALAQGELDVSTGVISVDKLNAMARGAKIRFVADKGHLASTGCTYDAFLARRVLVEAGELDSPAQLQARRISAIPRSHTGYCLDKLLNTVGLTVDDVEIVDIPEAAKAEAFKTGAIDVAVIAEPWVTRILRAGDAVLWMPVQQVIPDFQLGVILYGPTLLEENPDAGRRFMLAYLKAVRQYNQGKTERNLEILAEHTGLDADLLTEACWPRLRSDGQINAQTVLDFQEWALEEGLLDSLITEEQFWDPSFVEYANQVLGTSTQ